MSDHYYHPDGRPCYELPNVSKGGFRPVTVRDARKLSLRPSVTTVMQIKAKPGLDRYKETQAILASLTLPPIEGESSDAFVRRVREDAAEHARAAAEKGTAIHNAIEQRLLGNIPDEYWETACLVHGNLLELDDTEWIPERSFATAAYAGKVDAYCLPTRQHPHGAVVDFKGQEWTDKPNIYDDWGIQLQAYAEGLCLPEADRYSLVFHREQPLTYLHHWPRGTADRHSEMFDLCLRLWCHEKRYHPMEQQEVA